ncbi:MAG: ATP-binding cassette domain-containing protein [Pseudolactococcus laudensis]|uniref:ATP-binding cassette domain-containing protein n=1 Tax=Pseudolactococcus laudensis TaxID=1494461 RepID=UPI003F9CB5E6|nr:ABC transporter ATP-binding protein [Lactococcus sp.]
MNLEVIDGYLQIGTFKLDCINLSFAPGAYHIIIGKNGSGKTQLLKTLIGLNKLSSGVLKANDSVLTSKTQKQYLKSINYISADSRQLFPELTGWENCLFFAKLYGIKKSSATEKIIKLAADFELTNQDLEKKLSIYSNGMLQKIHFIRAFLNEPKIIFLDEPTTGLDIIQTRRMYDTLKNKQKQGLTIISVEHNLVEVSQYVDTVTMVADASVVFTQSKKELLNRYPKVLQFIDFDVCNEQHIRDALLKKEQLFFSDTPENNLIQRFVSPDEIEVSQGQIIRSGTRATNLSDVFRIESGEWIK